MNENEQALEGQSFAMLWRATWSVIGAHLPALAGGVVAIGVVGALFDVYAPKAPVFIQGLAQFFIQAMIVVHMLRSVVSDPETVEPRFGTLFGAGILANLATLVGLALFLVPGLILYARWILVWPLIMHENLRATDALGTSWRMTKGATPRLIALLIAPWLAGIAIIVPMTMAFDGGGDDGMIFSLFLNAVVAVVTLFVAAACVAIYSACSSHNQDLAQTFA